MENLLKHIRAERGRLRDLAAALTVTPSTILTWKAIPPRYVLQIENLTGITRYELRPDIYGSKSDAEAALGASNDM